jgi:lipopolysaccharide/colanic/teichoic acid biosynthesis glycosyltransferase
MHQHVLGHAVAGGTVEREQIDLDLLQRFDCLALSALVRDRALYYFSKRILDVVVSALALAILSPLLALVAVLIVLDSGWPIIFKQERVGAQRWSRAGYSYWRQTTFTCYKFRTMVRNANPFMHQAFIKAYVEGQVQRSGANGTQFKLNNDPRVTRIGRILRKASLDELPQLANVLKGDMSLVGPRPLPAYEVAEFQAWHRERLAALQGLTGPWQVHGRCQVPFEEQMRMDIEYVRNQSLRLDLKILILTIPAVLSGRGAE